MAAYPAGDPDVFFHLAAGREIVTSGHIPDTETLCVVSEGRPFRNHEWAYDTLLWLAHDAIGPAGVTVFQVGLAALLFALVGLLGARLGASPVVLAGVGLLFLPLFRGHLEARPHVAGYALAASALLALWDLRGGGRGCLGWLAGIQVVWTNVHGSFPLGLVLWGIVAATSFLGPRPRGPILWAGPLTALATLANPWGPDLWGVVLHHAEPAYRTMVPEWKPVDFGESPLADALFLALLGAGLLSFLPRANRMRLDRLALLLAFLVPATVASKFTLGLAVGAVPVLAANLSALRWMARPLPLLGLWGAALGAAVLVPPHVSPWRGLGFGLDLRDHPSGAVAFARQNGVAGRVFAPFHEGGYIAYAAYPDLRPYIDGRAYVHGLPAIRRYLSALADYRAFQDLHAEYRFDFVVADLLDPAFPRLLAGLQDDARFDLVYLDDRYAAFLPKAARPPGVEPFHVLRPSTDPRYLGHLPEAQLPLARSEVSRVLSRPEGEVLGRLLRGVLALREAGVGLDPDARVAEAKAQAACAEAFLDLQFLVRARPDVPMFRYFLAKALVCAGRCQEAKAVAARAAHDFPDARRLLRSLEACEKAR